MHSTVPENDRADVPLEGPPGFTGSSNSVRGVDRAISRNRLRPLLDGEIFHIQRLPSSNGPTALSDSPRSAIPRISSVCAVPCSSQFVESVAWREMYSEYQSTFSEVCERSQSAAADALLVAYCLISDGVC